MRSGKYLIIHVDDSPTVREIVKETLVQAGYIVRSADDAQDLERKLSTDPALRDAVDLFILDMEMPDMTGAQIGAVMQEVYNELSRVPFIIYSGKERDWIEERTKEVAGMSKSFLRNYSGYLAKKPGSEEFLVELVQSVLAKK